MRELVILRDRHCVFPWCGRDARSCDLDHIVAYVPPDEGGPPGQTNPQNLAPLCRRHHRAKTFTGWTYQRARDGTYDLDQPPRPHLDRRTRRHQPHDRALTHPGGPSRGVHPRHLTRRLSAPGGAPTTAVPRALCPLHPDLTPRGLSRRSATRLPRSLGDLGDLGEPCLESRILTGTSYG